MTRTPKPYFITAGVLALISFWLLWTLVLEESDLERDVNGAIDTALTIGIPAAVALALAAFGLGLSLRR